MSYIEVADLRRYLGGTWADTFTASAAADTLTLSRVDVRATMTTALAVTVSTTTTLPAPLAVDTIYYVILGTDQAIQLATTSALAAVPTAIVLTDVGVGTHTIEKHVGDDDLLQKAINASESYIEGTLSRAFEAETLTKYYLVDALDHDNGQMLHVNDDLLTITELLNGDSASTEIASDYYNLLPRNDGPPYYQILLTTNDGYYWEFDTDYWVSVTGTWGYSVTARAEIIEAATELAAFFYKRKDAQVFEITAIPEAGIITIPKGIPATVDRIIRKYKRYL